MASGGAAVGDWREAGGGTVRCRHSRRRQTCFLRPLPPRATLSRHAAHTPQSRALHPSHAPHRTAFLDIFSDIFSAAGRYAAVGGGRWYAAMPAWPSLWTTALGTALGRRGGACGTGRGLRGGGAMRCGGAAGAAAAEAPPRGAAAWAGGPADCNRGFCVSIMLKRAACSSGLPDWAARAAAEAMSLSWGGTGAEKPNSFRGSGAGGGGGARGFGGDLAFGLGGEGRGCSGGIATWSFMPVRRDRKKSEGVRRDLKGSEEIRRDRKGSEASPARIPGSMPGGTLMRTRRPSGAAKSSGEPGMQFSGMVIDMCRRLSASGVGAAEAPMPRAPHELAGGAGGAGSPCGAVCILL